MTPILAYIILEKSVNRKNSFLINGQQIIYEDLKSHEILMLKSVDITE
ncbi:8938_t:CDS:1, partial [Funneliformis mosseae]